jgi:large subunit ribosomal protein L10
MTKKATKIPEEKTLVVKELVELVKKYDLIGAVDLENLPTKQLQNMRAQLRSTVVLKMAKRRLIAIALKEAGKSKEGVDKLIDNLRGMPALIFTNDNPFSLYKTLDKNKSSAPIKAGQTAPNDIIVPAGPTGFAPGPVIGELGGVGIAAGIDNGKVIIKKDSKVASEGDVITEQLAALLTRLGIEPMEIGLNLTGAYENGTIFDKSVLAIDEQEYIDNITTGHRWAFNLAVEAGVLTAETTELMITKAFNNARGLALETNMFTKDTMPEMIAKAHRQMSGVNALIPQS